MRRFTFGLLALGLAVRAYGATGFTQTNLVSNNAAPNPPTISDPNLVNSWGFSMTPTSPFWVADNGKGVASLYSVDPTTQAPVRQSLVVTIPGDGSVTGLVFNPSTAAGAFNGDNFLFVSEDGTISGWRGSLGTTAENLQLPSTNAVYKGCTFDAFGGNNYLLSANFHTGNIDILKGSSGAPDLAGKFTDPGIPNGFAPFNIQKLGSTVYVSYAKIGSGKDETDGAGLGFVSAFDGNGNFLGRVASTGGTLNAPWGMAIAPASFAEFAGDLLVGNFGDGRINAFNPTNNSFVGQLNGTNGLPLSIDGLWGLAIGNGAMAGSTNAIYFSAGPDGESNGLFGVLTVPEPACLTILAATSILYCRPRRRMA